MQGRLFLICTFLLAGTWSLSAQTFDSPPAPLPPIPTPTEQPFFLRFASHPDPLGDWAPSTGLSHPIPIVPGAQDLPTAFNPYPVYPATHEPPNDPVDYLTGNFFQEETDLDFYLFGQPLSFRRFYNSRTYYTRGFGPKWTHTFDVHLAFLPDKSIVLETSQGGVLFRHWKKDSLYHAPLGVKLELSRLDSARYQLVRPSGDRWTFGKDGRLLSILDPFENAFNLHYDTLGRLAEVIDPVQRKLIFEYNSQQQIVQVSDNAGRAVHYYYDPLGRLAMVEFPHGTKKRYQYDASHHLTSILMPNGGQYRFSYRWDGRLLKSSDPLGYEERFKYPTVLGLFPGHKTVFFDRLGQRWDIHYRKGRIIRIKAPEDRQIRYAYGPQGEMIKSQTDQQDPTLFFYNAKGALQSILLPSGQESRYTYDLLHNHLKEWVDPAGRKAVYAYTSAGKLSSLRLPMYRPYTLGYKANGQLAWLTTPAGDTLFYQYDIYGHLATLSKPGGKVFFEHDAPGNLLAFTDETGQHTTFHYEAPKGTQIIQVQDGPSLQLEYDAAGLPVAMEATARGRTQFTYDQRGLPALKIGPEADTTLYHYDPLGRLAGLTNPAGLRIRYEWDASNRLTGVVDPEGNRTQLVYDTKGTLRQINEPGGFEVKMKYYPSGQLLQFAEPMGLNTRFSYGPLEQLTTLQNAKGQTHTYSYDLLGRFTGVKLPSGRQFHYTWDPNDQLQSALDSEAGEIRLNRDQTDQLQVALPMADTLLFQYTPTGDLLWASQETGDTVHVTTHPAGHITSLAFDGGAPKFTYDHAGNLLEATNAHLTYRFEYNASGKVTRTSVPEWGVSADYEYDKNGNRTALVLNDSLRWEYRYNWRQLLSQVTDPWNHTFRFYYDESNRLQKRTLPNGLYETYRYYPNHQKSEVILFRQDGQPLEVSRFFYDQLGNLMSVGGAETIRERYLYDAEGRLFEAAIQDHPTIQYQYNPAGERISRRVDTLKTSYAYAGGKLVQMGSDTFQYDARGNVQKMVIGSDTLTLAFDGLNRITCLQVQDTLFQYFTYDPFDQLIAQGLPDSLVYTFYDRWGNPLLQWREGGSDTTLFLPGLEPGEIWTVYRDSSFYAVHADYSGNVWGISDATGNMVNRYISTPFGERWQREEAWYFPFHFSGGIQTSLEAFFVQKGRLYGAESGQFLSAPPLTERFALSPGKPYQPYAFKGNNPLGPEARPLDLVASSFHPMRSYLNYKGSRTIKELLDFTREGRVSVVLPEPPNQVENWVPQKIAPWFSRPLWPGNRKGNLLFSLMEKKY